MKAIMKVFITKYALTQGIMEAEVEHYETEDMVTLKGVYTSANKSFAQYFHGEGGEWHKTFESARIKAENMRSKKIESLQKQIDKLKKLIF